MSVKGLCLRRLYGGQAECPDQERRMGGGREVDGEQDVVVLARLLALLQRLIRKP